MAVPPTVANLKAMAAALHLAALSTMRTTNALALSALTPIMAATVSAAKLGRFKHLAEASTTTATVAELLPAGNLTVTTVVATVAAAGDE